MSFFSQLQAALRDAPPEWRGVIDVYSPDGWWYVSSNATPVCIEGRWPGGADITIIVGEPAWTSSALAPETLPTLYAAGQVSIGESADPDVALALWGEYLTKRRAWIVAHP